MYCGFILFYLFTITISTFLNYISVAVVLCELAFFLAVHELTLKTCTVGLNLQTFSVAQASLELPLEFASIGIMEHSVAIHLVVLPMAYIGISITPFIGTLTIALIVFPLAFI